MDILSEKEKAVDRLCQQTETSTFSFGKVFPFFVLFFVAASIITTICVSMGIDASYFSFFKEVNSTY